MVRTRPHAFLFHLVHHVENTTVSFRLPLRKETQVGDLGRGEQHSGAIRTRCHTRTTTDAGGGIHRFFGHDMGDRNRVGLRLGP